MAAKGIFAQEIETLKGALKHVAVISLFSNLLLLTGPIYMLQVYDRVLASGSKETLAVLTGLVFFLFLGLACLELCRSALLSRAGRQFYLNLGGVAFEQSLEAARRGKKQPSLILNDTKKLRETISGRAISTLLDLPWSPVFLLIIFLMHPLLGIIALTGMLILICVAWVGEKLSRKDHMETYRHQQLSEYAALEAQRSIGAVDALGMRLRLRTKWQALQLLTDNAVMKASDVLGGLSSVSKATRLFLQSAILGTGAFLAIDGQVSAGVIIAASIISGRALGPIEGITSQWRTLNSALTSFLRIQKTLDEAKPVAVRTSLPAPKGELSVQGVICKLPDKTAPILKGISFSLRPGEALGIIGSSGSGKSTLARCLVGGEDIQAGTIRLDGASLDHWNPEELGSHIGYLPQESELLSGTIAQNICRFDDSAGDKVIVEAALAANAHEMILSLTKGYQTEIGSGGAKLSAGERQRIGLARALFQKPKLVVLDEPNAHLDAMGENALRKAMIGVKRSDATLIIIAHRLKVLEQVDKLLVLDQGKVTMFGPVSEVRRKLGVSQARTPEIGTQLAPELEPVSVQAHQ